jgi:WD40 repeat protein
MNKLSLLTYQWVQRNCTFRRSLLTVVLCLLSGYCGTSLARKLHTNSSERSSQQLRRTEPHENTQIWGDLAITRIDSGIGFTAFLPARDRLVLGLTSGSSQLWDTSTGKLIARLSRHQRPICWATFSPNGKYLLTADRIRTGTLLPEETVTRTVCVWDVSNGELVHAIDIPLLPEVLQQFTDWRFQWLDQSIVVGQFMYRLKPSFPSIKAILFRIDILRHSVVTMSQPLELGGKLVVSPNNKFGVATFPYGIWRDSGGGISQAGCGIPTTATLVDLEKLSSIAKLGNGVGWNDAEYSIIHQIQWSPDSRFFATIDSRYRVRIWNGCTGQPISTLMGHSGWVMDACFSHDGSRFLTASDDRTAILWDPARGERLVVFRGHTAGLNSARFDSTSSYVATGSEDQTTRLWSTEMGQEIRKWTDQDGGVREVEIVDGDTCVRSRTSNNTVSTWSIENGELRSRSHYSDDNDHFGVCELERFAGCVEIRVRLFTNNQGKKQ